MYTYDGWNRLMTVSHGYRDSSGNVQSGQNSVLAMAYDARGRRVRKGVLNTGSWDCTYNYYYNGNQQIEQRNGSNQTIRQNVWGLQYIDELIQTSLNSSPTSQSTCDTPYWALQDANWNVLGIVDSNGVLKERYEYSPYGQRTVYFSPGSNDPFCTAPTVDSQRFVASGSVTEPWGLCEFGHQGLMHDEEIGLVYDRARYITSSFGGFLQVDPDTYVDGLNLHVYEDNNPIINIDSLGLAPAATGNYPFVAGRGFMTIFLGKYDDYSSSFDVHFVPNAAAKCKCTYIDFVQDVLDSSDLFPSWKLDTSNPYPHQSAWAGGAGDAHAWDAPGASGPISYFLNQPFTQRFKTEAVCRKGVEAGKSYGIVNWDHRYLDNNVWRSITSIGTKNGPRISPLIFVRGRLTF